MRIYDTEDAGVRHMQGHHLEYFEFTHTKSMAGALEALADWLHENTTETSEPFIVSLTTGLNSDDPADAEWTVWAVVDRTE